LGPSDPLNHHHHHGGHSHNLPLSLSNKRRSQGGDSKYGFSPPPHHDEPPVTSSTMHLNYPPPHPHQHQGMGPPVTRSPPGQGPPELPPRIDRSNKPPRGAGGTLSRSAAERLFGKGEGGLVDPTDSSLDPPNYINATPHHRPPGQTSSSLERHNMKTSSYDSVSSYDSYNNRLGPNAHDDLKCGTSNGTGVSPRNHDPYRFTRSTAQPIGNKNEKPSKPPDYNKYRMRQKERMDFTGQENCKDSSNQKYIVINRFTNTCSLFMVYNIIHMMFLAFDTGIEAFSEVRRHFHSHSCSEKVSSRKLLELWPIGQKFIPKYQHHNDTAIQLKLLCGTSWLSKMQFTQNGSLISREQGASAGVTCCLFSLYRSLGYGTTSFDGKIVAISERLRNLLCHINKFKNAVILSDSKAAILSIVSKHRPSSQTAEITKMLSQLISLNKRIVFQWIPSHCGILGNENATALAKKGSTATYRPVTKSTYYSVKRFIKSTYLDFNKQNLITQSQGKKWNSLHHNPQLIPDLPRKPSVAAFRLATGHDCLAKHLHRIGIYQSPNCPLCNSNQEMDSEHLKICASVAGHDNIFEKYWSARGQMTLLPGDYKPLPPPKTGAPYKPVPPPKPKNYRPPLAPEGGSGGGSWGYGGGPSSQPCGDNDSTVAAILKQQTTGVPTYQHAKSYSVAGGLDAAGYMPQHNGGKLIFPRVLFQFFNIPY
ncbi:hypothetical protein ANN_16636, partial [Periplaneta americana]